MLPAGVKVTFIFTFTRANVIRREQKFTHNLHFSLLPLWVFMGVVGICGCLWMIIGFWVFMGVYKCLWVFTGVYRFLSVIMGFCVSMGINGCHGCAWVYMSIYEWL